MCLCRIETDGQFDTHRVEFERRRGSYWGMEGYFWIKRGENLCGLADCASYPIV